MIRLLIAIAFVAILEELIKSNNELRDALDKCRFEAAFKSAYEPEHR